jgi:curved DNA-binding protein CbpA
MQNLYDQLGVRPDDDAETLKKAFRKAAKASHPDHHRGDPQAAVRFRQISGVYEILRDPEQRAAYDRLLEFERRPMRHKVKRSLSDMRRHVVHDVMAGALLAIVLAVGYELFARVPETPGDLTAGVTVTAREGDVRRGRDPEPVPAPQMPVVVPTPPPTAASAANDHDRPAGQTIAVSSRASDSDVPTGAGVPGETEGEPPVRHDAPSVDTSVSDAEERNSVPAAGDRRDGKTPEPAGANTGGVKPPEINVKLPEIKVSARAPAAAKRHAPSRPRLEQAALENRQTPAPDNAPSPVFGVGF